MKIWQIAWSFTKFRKELTMHENDHLPLHKPREVARQKIWVPTINLTHSWFGGVLYRLCHLIATSLPNPFRTITDSQAATKEYNKHITHHRIEDYEVYVEHSTRQLSLQIKLLKFCCVKARLIHTHLSWSPLHLGWLISIKKYNQQAY